MLLKLLISRYHFLFAKKILFKRVLQREIRQKFDPTVLELQLIISHHDNALLISVSLEVVFLEKTDQEKYLHTQV